MAAVHPADRTDALNQWQQAVAERIPVDARFRLKQPGGGWRWTHLRVIPVLKPDGLVKKWLGLGTAISEKKEAKEAVQEARQITERNADRQLLQATIDSSLDMIQVFDAVRNEAGEIIDFTWVLNNKAAEGFNGDVIGKSLLTLNSGVVAAGIFDLFRQVIETGLPDQREYHYVHEQFDGWFCQSTVKMNGGVATTTTDITARKQTEQELTNQTHFIQAITEMMPDVITVVEYPSRTIIYSNRDSMILLGFDAEAIVNMSFADRASLFHPDDLSSITSFYDRFPSLKDNEENRIEYRLKNKKGDWVTLSLRGKVFQRNREGQITQVLLSGQDITERKKTQEEILSLKDEIAQKATDKYLTLFHSIDQAVAWCELITDPNGKAIDYRMLEMNPAFERMTGIPIEAARGKTAKEVIPTIEGWWIDTYAKVALDGKVMRVENKVEALNRWFNVYA